MTVPKQAAAYPERRSSLGALQDVSPNWIYYDGSMLRSDSHDDIGPCNLEHTERMLSDYILGDIEHLITLSHRIPFSE